MNKNDIIKMLQIKNFSKEYYELIQEANKKTREEFKNKAYIFAQIGIQASKCEGNCKFCSMAKDYYSLETEFEQSEDEVLKQVQYLTNQGVDDIFLMTTINYSIDSFINIGKKASNILPKGKRLVANIGDFSFETAQRLKNAGFTGAYHIKRLREGIDTEIKPQTRLETIENIGKAGLELYYCIEPIGLEHTYEEIADEILFARELKVGAMAVMRRIAIPKSPLFNRGQITKAELIKIAAVTRLAANPTRSMNVHETVEGSLLAGVNQLYAEIGANPRDIVSDTAKNRGLSVDNVKNLFHEYNYICD